MENHARFVGFEGGVLRLNLAPSAPRDLLKNLNDAFRNAGRRITAALSNEPGAPTIEEKKRLLFDAQLAEMSANPILHEVLARFPDSRVAKIDVLE